MKKKNILILLSLTIYCILFYQQSIGINLLIYNLLMISILLIIDLSILKNRNWQLVAIGAIITSVSAFLYGSVLSAIGNVISLILLSNLSMEKSSSLVFSFIQSGLSYVCKPFVALTNFIDRIISNDEENKKNKITRNNILRILIPTVVLLVFFLIYKNSNAIFSSFIDSIEIDISWNFIKFLIIGFYLIAIFFNHYSYPRLIETDKKYGNRLIAENSTEKSFFSTITAELSSANLTFWLLNGLLLIVNFLDVKFILTGSKSISNYSEYIHQGINSSIFSVVIAILVTLYFFRGNLNFVSENKTLKILALSWVAQNIILLLTCLHKNYSYIDEMGLTQKRLGVFFYLLVTLIGLILTWIKITRLKSNVYLVRTNTWSLFMILIISSLFNWNRIILNYNRTHKKLVEREYYFNQLPKTSLPYLVENWRNLPFESNTYPSDKEFKAKLESRKRRFIKFYESKQWQSWNLEDDRIYLEIKKIDSY